MDVARTAARARLVFAGLAATVVVLSRGAGATAAPSFRAILEAYRGGDRQGAVITVLQIQPIEIERSVESLIKSENDRVKKEGGPRIWLQTAAVLQLERLVLRGPINFSFNGIGTGRDQSWSAVTPLYNPPRGRRPEGPGTDAAFLRAWFRFMAAQEIMRSRWRLALQVIEEGEAQAGDDGELLLARGAVHEMAWRLEHDEGRNAVDFHGDLATAELALRRALDMDPALDEARLRLGRVQAKRGDLPSAIATLAAFQSPAKAAGYVYLARLFEGGIFEAMRDFRKAEDAYGAAMAAMPSSQSAQMALANLLHLTGRRDEALRRVTALSTGANSRAADDPWMPYQRGVAWRRASYLESLRAMVRQ